MARQHVTVDVVTPNWQYCELEGSKRGTKSGERCRFCKETKGRGQAPRYHCLLFNVELSIKGDAVSKTPLCYTNWKKNQIVDLTQEPEVSTELSAKDVAKTVQEAVKSVSKLTKQLAAEGIPEKQSLDIATKVILDDWK